ncbi:MAG: hypothetical protein ABTQ29_14145 [Siculibacillus sp.]
MKRRHRMPFHLTGVSPFVRCAVVLAAMVAGLAVASATAAEMPRKYVGVWGAFGCAIDKLDGEFPFLVVSAKGIAGHEAACDFKSATAGGGGADEIVLGCAGEGETWEARQSWKIVQKKTSVMGWTIVEPQLKITRDGEATIYRKCAFEAARTR